MKSHRGRTFNKSNFQTFPSSKNIVLLYYFLIHCIQNDIRCYFSKEIANCKN